MFLKIGIYYIYCWTNDGNWGNTNNSIISVNGKNYQKSGKGGTSVGVTLNLKSGTQINFTNWGCATITEWNRQVILKGFYILTCGLNSGSLICGY